jgi:hypothetical protein
MNSNLKMDINFLDKPLYFLNLRSVGKAFVWEDIEGYIYRSGYNLPDYLDMLILLFLVFKSQREGYKTEIVLTRYEILRECDLSLGERYYNRLEESLRRWKNVSIEFKGTFYDNKEYISMGFGILDDYRIDKETKKVHVNFNANWLLKVKESNFYKYINFEFYKLLKKPVSRRLYELMLPKCYDGNEWYIYATNFGSHLGIAKRTVRTKQETKEVLYASDVLVAMKAGFKEINQLCTKPDICEKLRVHPSDLYILHYRIEGTKQKRMLYIKKELVNAPNRTTHPPTPAQPLEFTEPPFAGILPPIHADDALIPPSALPALPKPSDSANVAPLPITENHAASWSEQYEQGIAWIKQTVPDFNLRALDGIDKEKLAAYFPKLKEKFAHDMAKGKVDNPGAYLLTCIRHQWERIKSRQEKQEEAREHARKEKEAEEQRNKEKKERQAREAELKKQQLVGSIKEHMEQLAASAPEKWEKAKAMAAETKYVSAFSIRLNFTKLVAQEFGIETADMDIYSLAEMAGAFNQYQPPAIRERMEELEQRVRNGRRNHQV